MSSSSKNESSSSNSDDYMIEFSDENSTSNYNKLSGSLNSNTSIQSKKSKRNESVRKTFFNPRNIRGFKSMLLSRNDAKMSDLDEV